MDICSSFGSKVQADQLVGFRWAFKIGLLKLLGSSTDALYSLLYFDSLEKIKICPKGPSFTSDKCCCLKMLISEGDF